jgi:hypothetical protein
VHSSPRPEAFKSLEPSPSQPCGSGPSLSRERARGFKKGESYPSSQPGTTRHCRELHFRAIGAPGDNDVQTQSYYREHAARARRLAQQNLAPDVVDTLNRLARDYDDIATDLDNGAIEIVHPSRMPQQKHTD